ETRVKIGIIAGMGAAAGAHFYGALIRECQRRGCASDFDFPEIFLHNIPSRATTPKGVESYGTLRSEIGRAIQQMSRFEPDKIIIACNSAHKDISLFRDLTTAEIVSLPESALKRCKGRKYGVLCSNSSRLDKVYPSSALYPGDADQVKITSVIETAMRGHSPSEAAQSTLILTAAVKSLTARGAERVILGCTELPIFAPAHEAIIDAGLCAIEDMLG
ncbi:MAG: aspartate/glutamate racemase family protein, partial [Patescibacteria group bacterium]|nr:aspartate/glutamate racemase family protein [Patescibacteria group bacterium]